MSDLSIAIVASESLQLEALLDALATLEVPPSLNLLALDHDSQTVLFNGRSVAFERVEGFDFAAIDVCMLLAESVAAEAVASALALADCDIVAWQADADHLAAIDSDRLFFVDNPYVAALKLVQQAIMLPCSAEMEMLSMQAMLPASLFGKAGVSELAAQTAKLLNGQAIEDGIFDQQVTFNYFPLSTYAVGESFNQRLASELQAQFEHASIRLRSLQMPVFHGFSAWVSLELSEPLQRDKALEWLRSEQEIVYAESQHQLSAMHYAQAQQQLVVGELRIQNDDAHQCDFLMGFDDAQFGVAKNWLRCLHKSRKSLP